MLNIALFLKARHKPMLRVFTYALFVVLLLGFWVWQTKADNSIIAYPNTCDGDWHNPHIAAGGQLQKLADIDKANDSHTDNVDSALYCRDFEVTNNVPIEAVSFDGLQLAVYWDATIDTADDVDEVPPTADLVPVAVSKDLDQQDMSEDDDLDLQTNENAQQAPDAQSKDNLEAVTDTQEAADESLESQATPKPETSSDTESTTTESPADNQDVAGDEDVKVDEETSQEVEPSDTADSQAAQSDEDTNTDTDTDTDTETQATPQPDLITAEDPQETTDDSNTAQEVVSDQSSQDADKNDQSEENTEPEPEPVARWWQPATVSAQGFDEVLTTLDADWLQVWIRASGADDWTNLGTLGVDQQGMAYLAIPAYFVDSIEGVLNMQVKFAPTVWLPNQTDVHVYGVGITATTSQDVVGDSWESWREAVDADQEVELLMHSTDTQNIFQVDVLVDDTAVSSDISSSYQWYLNQLQAVVTYDDVATKVADNLLQAHKDNKVAHKQTIEQLTDVVSRSWPDARHEDLAAEIVRQDSFWELLNTNLANQLQADYDDSLQVLYADLVVRLANEYNESASWHQITGQADQSVLLWTQQQSAEQLQALTATVVEAALADEALLPQLMLLIEGLQSSAQAPSLFNINNSSPVAPKVGEFILRATTWPTVFAQQADITNQQAVQTLKLEPVTSNEDDEIADQKDSVQIAATQQEQEFDDVPQIINNVDQSLLTEAQEFFLDSANTQADLVVIEDDQITASIEESDSQTAKSLEADLLKQAEAFFAGDDLAQDQAKDNQQPIAEPEPQIETETVLSDSLETETETKAALPEAEVVPPQDSQDKETTNTADAQADQVTQPNQAGQNSTETADAEDIVTQTDLLENFAQPIINLGPLVGHTVHSDILVVTLQHQQSGKLTTLSFDEYLFDLTTQTLELLVQPSNPGWYTLLLQAHNPLQPNQLITLTTTDVHIAATPMAQYTFTLPGAGNRFTAATAAMGDRNNIMVEVYLADNIDETLVTKSAIDVIVRDDQTPIDPQLTLNLYEPSTFSEEFDQTPVAGFEFGVPGVPVQFSDPVKVTIQTPDLADGHEVFVQVQHEGESTWDSKAFSADSRAVCTADGSITPTTPAISVVNGQVQFYTCRTSTFLLLDYPGGGPLLWLDASDVLGTGTNPADGAAINTWFDKSGNNLDFTFTGTGATPTLDEAGFNNLPTVQIDNTQGGFDAPAGFSTAGSDFTMFAAVQQDNGGAGFNGYYIYDQNAGGRFLWQQGVSNSSDAVFYDGAFGPTGFGSTNEAFATWVFDNGGTPSFTFRRDGAAVTTDTGYNVAITLSDDARLGERYTTGTVGNFQGHMSEIIIYDRVLDQDEIRSIERYLDCKWNLTGSDYCNYDVTVYREATAGDVIDTTVSDINWDTMVVEDPDISLAANTIDFEIDKTGNYFVAYSVVSDSTGGTNRSEIQSWLEVNGVDQVYGRGSSNIRRNNGANEGYNQGAAILSLNAGDTLRVQVQRTDSNTATVARRSNASGINILRLKESFDVAQARPVAAQTVTTAWQNLNLSTQDATGAAYTFGADNITFNETGKYLVTYNVGILTTGGIRVNDEARLVLDDVEVIGSRVTGYPRGTNDTNDVQMSWVGIIDVATVGDVLELEFIRESSDDSPPHQTKVAQSGITLAKIRDAADYVRVYEAAGGQNLATTQTDLSLDTAIEVDATSFSFAADTATVNQVGDYLFLHSAYNARTNTNNGPREGPFLEWQLNGTDVLYGNSGSYNRQSNDGNGTTNSSGSSSAVILPSLDIGDTVNLALTNEATDGSATMQADRVAMQGVYIPSLYPDDANISQYRYRWRDDSQNQNTDGGWYAAENVMYTDLVRNTPYRLRMAIANNGQLDQAAAISYQLQWGDSTGLASCNAITSWAAVDASSDVFSMVDVTGYTDGAATTSSILTNAEGYTYFSGQAKDATDATSALGPLIVDQYTELEWAVQAGDDAVTGHTYCFRLFDATNTVTIDDYSVYPVIQVRNNPSDTVVFEFGTSTLTDDDWLTVNLTGTFVNPIVVATPHYAATATSVPERVARIRNKTATSFELKVDNHDATVTGSTDIHWMVMESGTHNIQTDGGTFVAEAGTQNTAQVGVCNAGSSGNMDTVNFTQTFGVAPMIFHTIASDNDATNVSSVIYGSGTATSPSTASFQVGLDRSFDNCTHAAEDVDWIAIEPIHDTIGGLEFEISESGDNVAGCCAVSGDANTFTTPFATAPAVVLVDEQRLDGAQGGDAHVHSGIATSSTTYYPQIDEFGAGADRGHTNEPVGVVAFSAAGTIPTQAFFDTTDYQWYANNDALDPTVSLEAVNTPYIDASSGQILRLRMSVQNGVNDLEAASYAFKLQYAEADECSAAAIWNDVDQIGTGAAVWRGFDAAPVDGATITSSLLNGGTTILQSYIEQNNSPGNPNSAVPGDRIEYDWILENNGAISAVNYCFRMVTSADEAMIYTVYPQIKVASELLFTIDTADANHHIGFDDLTLSGSRYATDDLTGSGTEVEAHTVTVRTNATDGYAVTIQGPTLTNAAGGTIDAIGAINTAPAVGTEQFGLRATVTSGSGTVAAPYDGAGFAYDAITNNDLIFSANAGEGVNNVYSLRYLANMSSLTEAGQYETKILYTATASF